MEVLLNCNTGLRLLGFGALFVKDVGDNWVVHVQKGEPCEPFGFI